MLGASQEPLKHLNIKYPDCKGKASIVCLGAFLEPGLLHARGQKLFTKKRSGRAQMRMSNNAPGARKVCCQHHIRGLPVRPTPTKRSTPICK